MTKWARTKGSHRRRKPQEGSVIKMHPSNLRKRPLTKLEKLSGIHDKDVGYVMISLSSEDVYDIRWEHKWRGYSIKELSERYNILELEIGRILNYDIRDEGAATPPAGTTGRFVTGKSQYATSIKDKPLYLQNPFLSPDQVIEIRLRQRSGMASALEDEARLWGVSEEALQRIYDGDLFVHTYYRPNAAETLAFEEKHGVKVEW